MEHFVAGTTARCAAELVGVNRKTAEPDISVHAECVPYRDTFGKVRCGLF